MIKHPLSTISGKSKFYFLLTFLCLATIPVVYSFYGLAHLSNSLQFISQLSHEPKLLLNKWNLLSMFHVFKGVLYSLATTQLLHYVGGIFFAFAISDANKHIKDKLFKHIQKTSFSFFQQHGEAEIEKNITSYAESTCKIIELFFFYILPGVSTVIATLANSLYRSHADFTFYSIWLTVFLTFCTFSFRRLARIDEKLFFLKQKNSSFLTDLYKNILIEKTFQIQDNTYLKFLYFQEDEENTYGRSIYENNKQKAYLGMITNIFLISYMAFVLFFSNERSNLLSKCNIALNFNIHIWRTLASFLPLIFNFGTLYKTMKFFDEKDIERTNKEIVNDPHKITVKNLSYKINKRIILHDISFNIDHEVLVIKGFSGSGKSTLISIITGLIKCEPGSVYIDGKDVNSLDRHLLSEKINFLTQSSFIFNDTIKNNITIANVNHTEEQFERAISNSKVVNFTGGNVHELNRICGPSGSMISGGQAKRISMARLLIRDKGDTLIVLDEPFASLDKDLTEYFKSLIREFKNQRRSIIIIDHTNNCDEFADQILYLSETELPEFVY
jgi:ABC-type multidrug transport system fused ATPase/permease subunit